MEALLPKPSELARLLTGEHTQPHDILGAHALTVGGVSGVVIRALMPNAVAVEAKGKPARKSRFRAAGCPEPVCK